MTVPVDLPLPPMSLREVVGPRDDIDFDNPTGEPIYPEWPDAIYRRVFDFGCGCGRLARKLLQQRVRPERYIGIDPHRGCIDWAAAELASRALGFAFQHHDVYSPGYAPGNRLVLSDRFPAEDGSTTLTIAHSVFTHLSLDQAGFYLAELARILATDGVAFTTWFFFDNATTPFFPEGPYALYASEKDFAAAVIVDRTWFLDAIRRVGLTVKKVDPPGVPGHQWTVWLAKRTSDSVDAFPLDATNAGFLCGATLAPMATVGVPESIRRAGRTGSRTGTLPEAAKEPFRPPELYGALKELDEAKAELAKWKERAIGFRLLKSLAAVLGLKRSPRP